MKERYGVFWHYDMSQIRWQVGGSQIIKSFLHLSNDHKAVQLLNRDCFRWVINSGHLAYFWEDFWLEDGSLAVKLNRLYIISNFKHSSVRSFLENSNGSAFNVHLWSRPLITEIRMV